jgi:hypothetical protein
MHTNIRSAYQISQQQRDIKWATAYAASVRSSYIQIAAAKKGDQRVCCRSSTDTVSTTTCTRDQSSCLSGLQYCESAGASKDRRLLVCCLAHEWSRLASAASTVVHPPMWQYVAGSTLFIRVHGWESVETVVAGVVSGDVNMQLVVSSLISSLLERGDACVYTESFTKPCNATEALL